MRVLVAIVALVLAACGTGSPSPAASEPSPATAAPTGSTAPQPSELPSAAPSAPVVPTSAPATPAWTPLPAESALVNVAVTVLVDRLNMREQPAVAAKSLLIVEAGDFLLVEDDGPVTNGGYTWYYAVFLGNAGEPPAPGVDLAHSDGLRGWVAAAKGSAPYVQPLLPRCPSTIDLASVETLLGAERLACIGSNTIEISGTFGCSGCGGAAVGMFEPDWLAYPFNANFVTAYPVGDQLGPFAVRFSPDGPAAPPPGSVVRIRGHFDDAAADTCKISVIDPLQPDGEHFVTFPSAVARLVCAEEFVVETVEVLGTDPGFVFG